MNTAQNTDILCFKEVKSIYRAANDEAEQSSNATTFEVFAMPQKHLKGNTLSWTNLDNHVVTF